MAVVVLKHNTLITAPLFSGRESLPLSSSSHHHQAEWEKHLVVVAIFHTSREMKEKVMGCIVARHSPDRFRSENHHFDRLFCFPSVGQWKAMKVKKIAFFNLEKETVLPSWLLTTVFFSSSSGEQEGFFPFLFMSTCTVDGFHLSIWSSFPDSNIVFFFPRRFACRPVSSSLIWLMEEQWSSRVDVCYHLLSYYRTPNYVQTVLCSAYSPYTRFPRRQCKTSSPSLTGESMPSLPLEMPKSSKIFSRLLNTQRQQRIN